MQAALSQTERSIILGRGQLAIAARNAATAEDTLNEMQDSGNDTHALALAAGTQAEAAKKQAYLFEQANRQNVAQANAALEQSRLEQRAWGVTALNLEGDTLVATITNTGKTPAFRVGIGNYVEQECCDVHGTKTGPAKYTISDHRGTLQPGASIFDRTDLSKYAGRINTDQFKKKMVTRLSGMIEYRDVTHRQHWTHFCSEAIGELKTFNFCPYENDTDDDPETYPIKLGPS
jgi:hypothetical protein